MKSCRFREVAGLFHLLAVRPVWPPVRPVKLFHLLAVRPAWPPVRPVKSVRPVSYRSDRFHEQRPDLSADGMKIVDSKRFLGPNGTKITGEVDQHISKVSIGSKLAILNKQTRIGARVFQFGEEHKNTRTRKLIDRSYRGNQEL